MNKYEKEETSLYIEKCYEEGCVVILDSKDQTRPWGCSYFLELDTTRYFWAKTLKEAYEGAKKEWERR